MEETGYWQRLSRRRVLRSAAVGGAGLTAAALIGCASNGTTGGGTSTSNGTTKQPKKGGTLVRRSIGAGAFGLGFDPNIVSGNETGIMGWFYQGLLRPSPKDWTIMEPSLAQKWEQRSDTEYVFTLTPGVKWHNKPPVNGREFTAQDMVYALERARTQEPRFVNRTLIASVDKIEAVDKSTVRITSKIPDATTLLNVGDVTMLAVAPEVWEKWDKLVNAEQAIGTGPFILTDRDEVSAAAVRNPDYWKPGLPYLDGIKMQVLKDDNAAFAAFLAGQLDQIIVPGNEAKKFFQEQQTAKKWVTATADGVNTFFLMPNTRQKPYDDARVTKAIRLMMDHQEAVSAWAEVWFGSGTSTFLTRAMSGWDLPPEEYAKNLEWQQPKDAAAKEAQSLLAAAGFNASNPLKIELMGSTQENWNVAIAELQHAMWKRLSGGVIQAELKMVDDATARTREARGEFEIRAATARASWFDPEQLFRQVYHSTGAQNFMKWNDPQVDAMIDKQRTIFDLNQRKAAVRDVVRAAVEKAPFTPFAGRDWANAWKPTIQDIYAEVGRVPGHEYEAVWLDA